MFESLFVKVFSILSLQLLITFATAWGLIFYYRRQYAKGVSGIDAYENEKGQLDLELSYDKIKTLFWGSIIGFVGLFIVLLLVREDITASLVVFSMWSVVTGLMVGVSLTLVDENLGVNVLGVTASITVVTALIGLYSGIDFSFLGKWLLIALIVLIILNVGRLIWNINGAKSKLYSIFGVVVFTFYLIYDFNKLKTLDNDWVTAISASIEIYLDIINLFLYLLELMSKSK